MLAMYKSVYISGVSHIVLEMKLENGVIEVTSATVKINFLTWSVERRRGRRADGLECVLQVARTLCSGGCSLL